MPSGEVITLIMKLDDAISKSNSEKELNFLNQSLAQCLAVIILKIESLKKTKRHLRIVRQDEI